ncbi:TonB-dependent receptor (fragment) [Candidatus Sulfopaludibacter sp. SbA3]
MKGRHNIKIGTELKQTRLFEDFSMGITDPAFLADPTVAPGLVPYDLTRGGALFRFRSTGNINQAAVYVQDSVNFGNWSLNGGLRLDRYDGLSSGNGFEPRIGASYQIKDTGTVLRASFGRTFETPYNENLLLSSASGVGGLATNVFGAFGSVPLKPGVRNQFNTGLQQAIGRFLLMDANYFWKYTDTAYDFDVLFNTPVTFPIAWRKSKLDGVGARISTTSLKGFQAYMTLGHTRARFFGPETGGLIFNSPVNASVFRIDHDQALEQTMNLRYQRKKDSPWVDFTWRYDSGMVAGNVPDLASALALTGAQQAAIGFFCGGVPATIASPITTCTGSYGASRVVIPKAGTENADTNPPRIAPHHVFDVSVGTDNLLHTEGPRMTLRLSVLNLANEVALYNFLSTFSGTHFMTPRSVNVTVGVNF